MEAGDNFWFFFSGHGMRHANRDYLMPSDGDPGDIENTAISINQVTERLRRCGADNVVLILDACRSLGTRAGEGIGRQTAEEARTTGVISIFSCSPQEYSYEIEALQQGAFTHALLEGLGIRGQYATVERLNQYLAFRVPELVRQHKKARQTPYTIAEPVTKSHLILVPRYATLADIASLKNDAYQAEVEEDLELAEQLWIRVLAAASGNDLQAVRALQRIERLRLKRSEPPSPPSSLTEPNFHKRVPYYLPSFDQHIPRISPIRVELPTSIEPTCHPFNVRSGSLTDDLSSERGVDYTRLRDLLAAGKWKEADEETFAVMLKAAGRETEVWLNIESIESFPCIDLCTIDSLWVKYSDGRFGFSVQKRIWESVGGTPDADYETGCRFGEYVGWCVKCSPTAFGSWTFYDYDDLIFSLDAPNGHLPSGDIVYGLWRVRPFLGDNVVYWSLLSRRDL
ncbi:MAG: GUN4 domain-containing protein [Symplocastrum torsivum CPER-KK1]|uniref:GUN4 domain-containing protein n=1 Tax=Symplocastrum torsivum CPER-KK1 TaxID=450513 RepID=A0A951PHW8_9CYAN|nr:GUN4 domain-containing protein [Symplocastrum torsivum CPER-KK1]